MTLIGLALLSGFLSLAYAKSPKQDFGLTADQLSELSALFTSNVREVQLLNHELQRFGVKIAFYGGTSREVIDEVIEGIYKKGSVSAYRAFLEQGGARSYLDWHRLGSDLDFYVLGEDDKQSREAVRELVLRAFPPSLFYKSVDVLWPEDFFKKFPPGDEHFEATSNIVISTGGILYPEALDVQVNGKPLNLGRWGVDQFLSGQFDFERNLDRTQRPEAYRDLRQVLRWIRYASEFSWMQLSQQSKLEIQTLLNSLLSRSKDEVVSLLRQGNSLRVKPSNDGEKLLEALEKLQLYSGNPFLTSQLLKEVGLIALFQEAGIAEQRVFAPLRSRTPEESRKAENMPPVGGVVKLRHRTHLTAAQSISRGALWMSDGKTIIKGRTTMSAMTDAAIYAAPDFESLSYGDYSATVYLSPLAIEGIDFVTRGSFYAIRTREALIHPGETEPRIERVTSETLIENSFQMLEQANDAELEAHQRESIFRVLGSLIQPWRSEGDLFIYNRILELVRTDEERSVVQHRLFSQVTFISDYLNENVGLAFSADFQKYLSVLSEDVNKESQLDHILDVLFRLVFFDPSGRTYAKVQALLLTKLSKKKFFEAVFWKDEFTDALSASRLPDFALTIIDEYLDIIRSDRDNLKDLKARSEYLADVLSSWANMNVLFKFTSQEEFNFFIDEALATAPGKEKLSIGSSWAKIIADQDLDFIAQQLPVVNQILKDRWYRDAFYRELFHPRKNIFTDLRQQDVDETTRRFFEDFLVKGFNGRRNRLPRSFVRYSDSLAGLDVNEIWFEIKPLLAQINSPVQRARFFIGSFGRQTTKLLFTSDLPDDLGVWISQHTRPLAEVLFGGGDGDVLHEGIFSDFRETIQHFEGSRTPSRWGREVIAEYLRYEEVHWQDDTWIGLLRNEHFNKLLRDLDFDLWSRVSLRFLLNIPLDPKDEFHWKLLERLSDQALTIDQIREIGEQLVGGFDDYHSKINDLFKKFNFVNYLLYQQMWGRFSFSEDVTKLYKSIEAEHIQAEKRASSAIVRGHMVYENPLPIIEFYNNAFGIDRVMDLIDHSVFDRLRIYFDFGVGNFSADRKKSEESAIFSWLTERVKKVPNLDSFGRKSEDFEKILLHYGMRDRLINLLSTSENIPQLREDDQRDIFRALESTYSWHQKPGPDGYSAQKIESFRIVAGLILKSQAQISASLLGEIKQFIYWYPREARILPEDGSVSRASYWVKKLRDFFGTETGRQRKATQENVNELALPKGTWTNAVHNVVVSIWKQLQPTEDVNADGEAVQWSRRFDPIKIDLIEKAPGFPQEWMRQAIKDLTSGSVEEIMRTFIILSKGNWSEEFLRLERALNIGLDRLVVNDKVAALHMLLQRYLNPGASERAQSLALALFAARLAEFRSVTQSDSHHILGLGHLTHSQFLSYIITSRHLDLFVNRAPPELVYEVLVETQSSPELLNSLAYGFEKLKRFHKAEARRLLQFMIQLPGWPASNDLEKRSKQLVEQIEAEARLENSMPSIEKPDCFKLVKGPEN